MIAPARLLVATLAAAAASVPLAALARHGQPVAEGPCEMRSADRRSADSRRCLSCHDGSTTDSVMPGRPGSGGDHPIDVNYLSAFARGGYARLRAPGELPPALPLVNGKVACTTCHAGDSREPKHTALPMVRSALCTACHGM